MAKAKYFAWVDLETSGTDEMADPILEVGLVVTEAAAPCKELKSYEAVVRPDLSRYPSWLDGMDSYVTNMHTVNGLLDEVSKVGRPVRDVEQDMIDVLSAVGRPHNFMLAGSGVGHFDRKFLETQMPDFSKWLQYPNLDVGVLRRGLEFSGRTDLVRFGETFDEDGKPHRGLADVRDHLEEFRSYADMFGGI